VQPGLPQARGGQRALPAAAADHARVPGATADRGSFDGGHHGRQDHFQVVDRDWRVTYETAYGHQIRVAFPPDDEDDARAVIVDAVLAMGCRVLSARTVRGEPVWGTLPTSEDQIY
jgi:hypothetical protein